MWFLYIQRRLARPALEFCRCSISAVVGRKRQVSMMMPGGGLEKFQGGIREEEYFSRQNLNLIEQIGKSGNKLKCENCDDANWEEFEKVDERSTIRDTCLANKHKRCMEEAFFLNEQMDSVKHLNEKMQHELPKDEGSSAIQPISNDDDD